MARRDLPAGGRGRGGAPRDRARRARGRAPARLPPLLRRGGARGRAGRSGAGRAVCGRGHLARPRVRLRRARDRRRARAVARRAPADPRRRPARRAVGGARRAATIDIVSSDHCPRVAARGLAAGRRVGDRDAARARPPLRRAHRADRPAALGRRLLRAAPARILGLDRKGRLEPGADADIVLFDPAREVALCAATLHSALPFSSYEGVVVRGYPVVTISRGEVIVRRRRVRRGARARAASSSGAGRTGNLREAVGRSATLARRGSAVRVFRAGHLTPAVQTGITAPTEGDAAGSVARLAIASNICTHAASKGVVMDREARRKLEAYRQQRGRAVREHADRRVPHRRVRPPRADPAREHPRHVGAGGRRRAGRGRRARARVRGAAPARRRAARGSASRSSRRRRRRSSRTTLLDQGGLETGGICGEFLTRVVDSKTLAARARDQLEAEQGGVDLDVQAAPERQVPDRPDDDRRRRRRDLEAPRLARTRRRSRPSGPTCTRAASRRSTT